MKIKTFIQNEYLNYDEDINIFPFNINIPFRINYPFVEYVAYIFRKHCHKYRIYKITLISFCNREKGHIDIFLTKQY